MTDDFAGRIAAAAQEASRQLREIWNEREAMRNALFSYFRQAEMSTVEKELEAAVAPFVCKVEWPQASAPGVTLTIGVYLTPPKGKEAKATGVSFTWEPESYSLLTVRYGRDSYGDPLVIEWPVTVFVEHALLDHVQEYLVPALFGLVETEISRDAGDND